MAKTTKKNLKLRRRIRRTMGTICLITALVVAAIPVPETAAADSNGEGKKYLWTDDSLFKDGAVAGKLGIERKIPEVDPDVDPIYTTGDGTYQFAYKYVNGDNVAIILGYNSRNLVNNYLEIPDEVNAYGKFRENQGSFEGYVAVSKMGEALFYVTEYADEPVLDELGQPKVDDNGDPVTTKVPSKWSPCYYANYNAWKDTPLEEFYIYDADGKYKDEQGVEQDYEFDKDRYLPTKEEQHQWIKNIKVFYIGNQTLSSVDISEDSGNGNQGSGEDVVGVAVSRGWNIVEPKGSINESPSGGIFANNTNIRELVIGENLKGIGNYAFYGCAGLEKVDLDNGLEEIGQYAFANCINIKNVSIPFSSNLTFVSNHAFQNCRALTDFVLPSSVMYIFDHAFDGCVSLSGIDISGKSYIGSDGTEGANVSLLDLGYYVFKGCTALEEICIPYSFTGESDNINKFVLNNFKGCTGLKCIEVQTPPNSNMSSIELVATTGIDGDTFSNEDFVGTVPEEFYFKCAGNTFTHQYTKDNALAFKYADADIYEKTIKYKEKDDDGVSDKVVKVTYQVNSNNELIFFSMESSLKQIELPASIGPKHISAISSNCFSGDCVLTKIIIPATVQRIEANAFKGCHNLTHVIFRDATSISEIGDGAFDTQVVDVSLHENCTITSGKPVLTFTGEVGSGIVPYVYAMNPANNINYGTQSTAYITYYSGWPSNLEIQYNPEKDTAELISYPSYERLSDGFYTADNYPYMNSEYTKAAAEALSKYANNLELTDYEKEIIDSALNVVIPEGVTSIADGLFSGVIGMNEAGEPIHSDSLSPDVYIEGITSYSVETFKPYTIYGCSKLRSIDIRDSATMVEDYAFAGEDNNSALVRFSMSSGGDTIGDYILDNHPNLNDVTISPDVKTIGLRIFRDCSILKDVSFGGGPYFVCDNSIIYGLTDGEKTSIVQCLPSRSTTVAANELAGIVDMHDEAFKECEKLGSIDLSSSKLSRVPKSAFEHTTGLYSVMLPTTCKSISDYAFFNSKLQFIEIPSSVTFIAPNAFNNTYSADDPAAEFRVDNLGMIEFKCVSGSAAETYAQQYPENIVITDKEIDAVYVVTFWDYVSVDDNNPTLTIVDEQEVKHGEDAVPPTPIGRDGYVFKEWSLDYTNVSRDMDISAVYEKASETKHEVRFIDWNDTVISTQQVAHGGDAIVPRDPERSGYKFTGWRPSLTNITEDTDIYAFYEPVTSSDGTGGTGGNGGNSGTGGNGGTSGDGTLYTLTVKNGSGSGSYVAGAQIPIIANEAAKGQRFDEWKVESGSPTLVSSTIGATFLTMPEGNVIISATFEKDPNYSGSSNSGNNSGNSNNNNNGGSSTTKPGTVIVIDKNGLSNTGVVSATVNGSSDNFVIKVTEDRDATEAILRALKAEFGSLDNLKYFPMDISLYDSTGKTKITDTTGLSITITLPLPDSLIKYAGNNKVASVQNSKLDKLGTKFATIDGVACVTFTAEHFSPYVIYVDTGNLISAGTTDESPKTGDIHPKWFLVFGLTCMAAFLFLKKDKQAKKVLA